MNWNERLTELREKHDYTQAQIAEILEIKRARYNAWENGISQPSIQMLKRIATHYHVSLDYLLGYSEMKNSELDRKNEFEINFRILQRVAMELSPEQRKEGLKMWEFLFKNIIENAKKQEGLIDRKEQ